MLVGQARFGDEGVSGVVGVSPVDTPTTMSGLCRGGEEELDKEGRHKTEEKACRKR